jgi:hypothetical protein
MGLKDEIRSAIALHQPKDVATASTLACLQEEELARSHSRSSGRDVQKLVFKFRVEKSKAVEPDKTKAVLKNDTEDKLATLREFRRNNGLCFKCGGKWEKAHKCPAQIPIHVLEELLDALEESDPDVASSEEKAEEVVMVVGQADAAAVSKRRTLKLHGQVGKVDILILVDSRSVGTFVSESVVAKL